MREFEFPVGYHRFHRKQLFNFQLNRWHSLGYARFEDMRAAGRGIRDFTTWRLQMLALADRALDEGRLAEAAFCVRAAEFYVRSTDPEKQTLYERFVTLFDEAFEGDRIERRLIPYEGASLSAIRVAPPSGGKGTVVIHGGFDSFLEEWYSMMCFFAGLGYEVIGFEGPGQGAALRRYGLPLTYEWEKPTGAVLDHFGTRRCTLVGMSMGGWFALRAAAFEPRVERVVASGHAMDYMQCMPPAFRWVHLWCMEHCRGFMERMAELKFENREGMAPWAVDHMKYITKREKPLDAMEIYLLMNEGNLHPERVRQDVLILAGREDHLVPFKMYDMQIRSLTGARSVTGRVFTREEHAQNHCQMGNFGLALDVMARWIASRI